jgi:hypothetical protein
MQLSPRKKEEAERFGFFEKKGAESAAKASNPSRRRVKEFYEHKKSRTENSGMIQVFLKGRGINKGPA